MYFPYFNIRNSLLSQGVMFYSILLFFSSLSLTGWGQCNAVPVRETVFNGNFSAGDTGFTVGYPTKYVSLSNGKWSAAGKYLVSNNDYNGSGKSTLLSPAWDGVFDHTQPGVHGNMLMIDVAGQNNVVWQQQVLVQPNQLYYFSAWMAELINLPVDNSILKLQIMLEDGTVVGISNPDTAIYKTWKQIYATWLSGPNAEQVTLQIIDTQVGNIGNDLALDDISFMNGCNSISTNKPDLGVTQTLCGDGQVTLNSSVSDNAQQWSFTPPNSDTEELLPDTGPSIIAKQAGTYQVCVTSAEIPGCPVASFVNVLDSIDLNLGPDINLCDPSVDTIKTNVTGSELSYQWKDLSTGKLIPGATGPDLIADTKGDYSVTVSSSVPMSGCKPVTDSIKILSGLAIPIPGYFCKGNAVFSIISQGGQYAWYKTADVLTDRKQLGSGTSIKYPVSGFDLGNLPGDTTVTLYVEDTSLIYGNAGASVNSLTPKSYVTSNQLSLSFDVIKEFVLDSIHLEVKFNASGNDMQGSVTILQSNGAVLKKITVTIPNPNTGNTQLVVPVYIGAVIPTGNNYKLILGDDPSAGYDTITAMKTNNDANGFPYIVPGVLAINALNQYNQDYNFFYDWDISYPSGCSRVPVTLTRRCICKKPVTFHVSPTTGRTICSISDTSIVLTVSDTLNSSNPDLSQEDPDHYYYEWFKADPITNKPTGNLLSNNNTLLVTSAMGSGKYLIRLSHQDSTNAGCYLDSIITLKFDQPFTPNIVNGNDTICSVAGTAISKVITGSDITSGSGILKYQWQSFTTAGGPYISETSVQIDTLTLSLSPVPGTYYYRRVITGNSCPASYSDSAILVILQKLDPGSISGNDSICFGEIPTVLANENYPSGGSLLPPAYSYQWLSSADGQNFNVVNNATSETYAPNALSDTTFFERSVVNGNTQCDKGFSNIIKIIVYPELLPGNIKGGDTTICANQSVKIPGTTPASGGKTVSYDYGWEVSTDQNAHWMLVPNANAIDLTTDSLTDTTWFRRIIIGSPCDSSFTNIYKVNVEPLLPQVETNYLPLGPICTSGKQQITVNPTNAGKIPTFTWYYNGQIDTAQITATYTNTNWDPDNSTVRVVIHPSSDICSAGPVDTTIHLVIQNIVTPTVTIDPAYIICGNDEAGSPVALKFTATASEGGGSAPEYQFSIISNGISKIVQPFSTSDSLLNGTFVNGDSVEVILKSDFGCVSQVYSNPVSKLITIVPTPEALVDQPAPACYPSPLILSAKNSTTETQYQWIRDGIVLSDQTGQTITDYDTGNHSYQLVVTNTINGLFCRDTSATIAANIDYLSVDAGPDQETALHVPVELTGSRIPDYAIMWESGNLTEDSTLTFPSDSLHPLANPGRSTWYTLTMTDPVTGCKAIDSVLVIVSLPIWIPNAFSPNNDEVNDTWIIDGIESYPDNYVVVFNRWGSVVYEKNSYKNTEAWNGTAAGGIRLPTAVYYYMIDPKDAKGGGPYTGNVTVLK